MGSLASRPSVPTQTVIYKTVDATTDTTSTTSDTSSDTEQTAAEIREESLLQRDRGRSGTVTTSFRGLLDMIENNEAERKTLLGQ